MSIKISSNAGHSNPPGDPGAVGSAQSKPVLGGQTEAMLARNMNKAFIDEGKRRGYDMNDGTRPNGSTAEQANFANGFEARLAVSWHFNSFSDPKATGVEVWIHTNTSAANRALAAAVSAAMAKAWGLTNRGVKTTAAFNFLNRTNMPAMLIECAFISNPDDMRKVLANGMAGVNAAWGEIAKAYPLPKAPATTPAQPVTPPAPAPAPAKDAKDTPEYKELMMEYTAVVAERERLQAAVNLLAAKNETMVKDLESLLEQYK